MIFKGFAFVIVVALIGLIDLGPSRTWAMGGGPIQQLVKGESILLVKAQPITESNGNVYIRYKQKIDPYSINDESSLQEEGMLFVNDTLLEMTRKFCPNGNNLENGNLGLNGSIPFQGVDGKFYFYIFSVNHSALDASIQGHCVK